MARISNIIIYFAPHQDDELLSMGVDICNSIKKGKDVHVVLCTDGSSSGVKNILKNGKTCKKHSGVRTPSHVSLNPPPVYTYH